VWVFLCEKDKASVAEAKGRDEQQKGMAFAEGKWPLADHAKEERIRKQGEGGGKKGH